MGASNPFGVVLVDGNASRVQIIWTVSRNSGIEIVIGGQNRPIEFIEISPYGPNIVESVYLCLVYICSC